MPNADLLLYALIIACEASFWLILVLALALRYRWQRLRLSRALLYGLPLVDLLLLLFTVIDLRRGATATFAHGLAAAYVGFTLAFGGMVVRWADAHIAHRFAGGPAPAAAPTRGWALLRYDLLLWLRCILACAITLLLVEALIAAVGAGPATEPLLDWHRHAFGCVVLWLLFGPLWSLVSLLHPRNRR
ncbi:MAG: hypothetical protein U1F26_10135 [Lysobacterales bacterium]